MDPRAQDLEGVSGIVVADAAPGFPITYVSAGFEALTGFSAAEVVGGSCSVLQGPDTDPRSVAVLREALSAGREANVTLLNYRADGTPFWNELSLAPEHDADGTLVRYLGVQRDVTAQMRADARIAELAYFDPLTGLANRAALHDELRCALHQARMRDRELGLLFLDLDDFKRVNDQYGHHVGDALLSAVAARLRSVVRPQDLLARQGGDEFTLLLKDLPGNAASVATELAARIVDAVREPLLVEGFTLEMRASVGISTFPRDAVTAEDLLRHADAAMYMAKAGGKDGFHVYHSRAVGLGLEPDAAFAPEAHVEELDRVLRDGLVTSLFQPIVALASGATVGYEALARGPERSALHRPDRLFAAAQAADRVVELDWACRAAALDAALDAGLEASLFINCEPSAIDAPCPERHRALWERAQRELSLVLEITERALTERPAGLVSVVAEHRAQGRRIALDDLGADVRSLALLPLVEPDVIKLDLRLVQDRPSTDQAAIVSAVAAENERTGAAILAEGIETEEHLAVARTLGATLGQGWLWGRPAPLPAQAVHATPPVRSSRPAVPAGATPYEVIAAERPVAIATKQLLLPMSHHLENHALRIGEGAVILSAFQEAQHFTPTTARRYAMLARSSSLVAALGTGLSEEPVRGVRGANLEPDDILAGEWSVVVIAPHFSGALVARDLGDGGAQSDRRFTFATTYDRALVLAAARTLLTRIAPRREALTL